MIKRISPLLRFRDSIIEDDSGDDDHMSSTLLVTKTEEPSIVVAAEGTAPTDPIALNIEILEQGTRLMQKSSVSDSC